MDTETDYIPINTHVVTYGHSKTQNFWQQIYARNLSGSAHRIIGERPYEHLQITLDHLHAFRRHPRTIEPDTFEVYIVRGFLRDMKCVF